MRTKAERIALLQTQPPWFMFEFYNYKCLAVKHSELLHYCGYVQLPENHPISIAKPRMFDDIIVDLNVHGGVTYSEQSAVSFEWVVGFDCAHGGDMTLTFDGMHRTAEFVINELRKLSKQLKDIEGGGSEPLVKSCYTCEYNRSDRCSKTGLDLSRAFPNYNWHCSEWSSAI